MMTIKQKKIQTKSTLTGVYFKMRASQPYITFFAIHPLIPHPLIGVFQVTDPTAGVKKGASLSPLK
jgi:hypothetical protein